MNEKPAPIKPTPRQSTQRIYAKPSDRTETDKKVNVIRPPNITCLHHNYPVEDTCMGVNKTLQIFQCSEDDGTKLDVSVYRTRMFYYNYYRESNTAAFEYPDDATMFKKASDITRIKLYFITIIPKCYKTFPEYSDEGQQYAVPKVCCIGI